MAISLDRKAVASDLEAVLSGTHIKLVGSIVSRPKVDDKRMMPVEVSR